MSEIKFTKGKWLCVDGTRVGEQVLFISSVAFNMCICRLTKQVDNHTLLSDEDIANAHLIASAPDMYAMIKELIDGGTELLNIDDIEDSEDAASIHSKFNDKLIEAISVLKSARGES